MKKSDFKKLALMGIAGGILLTSEANAGVSDSNSFSLQLAARGCGGQGGCGNSGGNQGYVADNYSPGTPSYHPQPSQGCSATHAQTYQQQSYQAYQPSQGCGSYQGMQPSQACGSYQGMQPSQACGSYQGMQPSQGWAEANQGYQPSQQSYQQQPSQGCASAQTRPQHQPQQPQSRWETAYDSRTTTTPTTTTNSQTWNRDKKNNSSSSPSQQWGGQKGNQQGSRNGSNSNKYLTDAAKPATAKNLTETELQSQLNSQGKALFTSLSPEGKALALKLANQTCKGQNECKGLNSCKDSEHSCAGKGNCAGTSSCSYKDKNSAVKVAAMKMAEKRAKINR